LAVADAFAFYFRFHIADQLPGHPALAADRGGVVGRTVEVETAQDIKIQLSPALQMPLQSSSRDFAYCRFAGSN
jgi:hypothetical protein